MSNASLEPDTSATGPTPVAAMPASAPGQHHNRDLQKQQQALVALGHRVAAAPDPSVQMQDAAALLAEMLNANGSGMAELSPDGQSLRMQLTLGESASGESAPMLSEMNAEATDSLAGFTLQTGRPVIVTDLSQEKRFTDSRLRKQPVQSAVAVPLVLNDRSFGVLLACSSDLGHFDEQDVPFAEAIGQLVAGTIARCRAEASLDEERRLTDGMLQTVEALVLVLDTRWQIVRINAACEHVTGFSIDEVRGRPIWNVLAVPEEVAAFQRLNDDLPKSDAPVEFEGHLLTKRSDLRQVAWTCSMIHGGDGTPQSIVATGIDITPKEQPADGTESSRDSAEGGPFESGPVEAFSPMPIPINAERRIRPRRAYPYRQRICEVVDDVLPDRDQFREIQCNDIAAGGFSFLCSSLPTSKTLVVELGVAPKVTYLMAHVAHSTRFEQDGKPTYLIGCNYVGRAVYPADDQEGGCS